MDYRISRALKAGLLGERPPVLSRYQVMRSAASGVSSPVRRAGWGIQPRRPTPSSERSRQRDRQAIQGRNYGYVVVAAGFRLAW